MALALADVTKLTAATATIEDVMAAIRAEIAANSSKWGVKANGPSDTAFTLVPVAAAESFEINLRQKSSTVGRVLIDPLENITAPGAGGDPGTAPTLTDSSEDSGEHEALVMAGTESVDFYLIELDDAIIVLFMDATKAFNPYCWQMGRVYIPFFDDGSNGDSYADGLGFLCGVTEVTTATSSGPMLSSSTSNTNRIRTSQTTWDPPGSPYEVTSSQLGRIGGNERPRPQLVSALDVDGASDNLLGFTRYILRDRTTQDPGARRDGGAGNDGWVFVNDTDAADNILIPWDRSVTPEF